MQVITRNGMVTIADGADFTQEHVDALVLAETTDLGLNRVSPVQWEITDLESASVDGVVVGRAAVWTYEVEYTEAVAAMSAGRWPL